MSSWKLPDTLEVAGTVYHIRTDFRDILTILNALGDPDLPDNAKVEVMLIILYEDFDSMPEADIEEAVQKGMKFINHAPDDDKPDTKKPTLMDWEQDADMIIPAINKVAGVGDVRSLPYLHWWTFLGYYMEIGDCLFSQVLNIRYKRAHGKKLEKYEREFEKDNRGLIRLRKRLSDDERERMDEERKALEEMGL